MAQHIYLVALSKRPNADKALPCFSAHMSMTERPEGDRETSLNEKRRKITIGLHLADTGTHNALCQIKLEPIAFKSREFRRKREIRIVI